MKAIQAEFPSITEFEAHQKEVTQERARTAEIEQHQKTWETCWPEWKGPEVGGYCQVYQICAIEEDTGESRYHYMAPVRLTEQIDSETWIGVVEYDFDTLNRSPHLIDKNGTRLRLGILNIWAPVQKLIREQHSTICH